MKKYIFALIVLFSFSVASKDKIIKMVTTSWPPYYDTAKDSIHKGAGVFLDISKAAFKKVGYDLQVSYYPWNRAMQMSSSGDYPGLFGPYYSSDRAKNYAYTDAVLNTENVFFAKKGRKIKWKTIKDLAPYTIGVGSGWAYSDEFDNAKYLKKQPVPEVKLNVKKLAAGRVDIFIGAKAVVLYEIEYKLREYIGMFEVVKPSFQVKPLHNAFSRKRKDYRKIVSDFNRGLKLIRKDGTYAKILKKYAYLQIGK